MQVKIKGGETVVELTKQEKKTLRSARLLLGHLAKWDDSIGNVEVLNYVLEAYCEEPAE